MPKFPVVVKIGHAHSGIGKVNITLLINSSMYRPIYEVHILYRTLILHFFIKFYCLYSLASIKYFY